MLVGLPRDKLNYTPVAALLNEYGVQCSKQEKPSLNNHSIVLTYKL
jgi:hypothetical protein